MMDIDQINDHIEAIEEVFDRAIQRLANRIDDVTQEIRDTRNTLSFDISAMERRVSEMEQRARY